MAGKKYLTDQTVTLLKLAKATTDRDVAARILVKAADLTAKMEEAPDTSLHAPDIEQPEA